MKTLKERFIETFGLESVGYEFDGMTMFLTDHHSLVDKILTFIEKEVDDSKEEERFNRLVESD